jgi:electron transport complex protein RnfG
VTAGHAHGAAPQPAAPAVRSWRLLATLGGAGAIAGGLIVTAYTATLPRIEAHRAALVEAAVREVLGAPVRWDTLYLRDGRLTREAPPSRPGGAVERAFLGFDAAGTVVGAAVTAGEPGFSDMVSVIFGLDPATGTLLGMTVLAHKETPGLGDKIERPAFLEQFRGVATPLAGVKGTPSAPGEVQTVTGATISSRAVLRIINNATDRWRPLLQDYLAGGAP